MSMKKRHLNLLVSENLIKRAREHNINISSFLEIRLQEYLALIDGKQVNSTPYVDDNGDISVNTSGKGKTNNHNSYSKDAPGAYGLVVMTSPSHGGGLRFKSG